MVTLKVGTADTEHSFLVHKKLLCTQIPYFQQIFAREGDEPRLTSLFPEELKETFDLLLRWLYTGKVQKMEYVENQPGTPTWKPRKLYALAHKLRLPSLQDQIMDVIHDFQSAHQAMFRVSAVRRIYESTPAGCALRKFGAITVACLLVYHGENRESNGNIYAAMMEIEDLGRDVVACLRNRMSRTLLEKPWATSKCEFHSHARNALCTQNASD